MEPITTPANMPVLSVNEFVDLLAGSYIRVIENGLPPKVLPSVMLWGAPGVGKSQGIGFEKEINKIMTEIISDEELENAKNNTIGRRQFYTETNLSEASLIGYHEFLGLGYNFEEKLIASIKLATKEQILETAKKYFSGNNALCVLAPEKFLKEADLIK